MEEEKEDNKILKIIRFTAKGDESGNGLCPVLLFMVFRGYNFVITQLDRGIHRGDVAAIPKIIPLDLYYIICFK